MIEFQHKLPTRYNADGKACGKMILIKKTKESFLFILLNLNNGMMRICIQAMEIGFRASTLKNNKTKFCNFNMASRRCLPPEKRCITPRAA